MYSKRICAPLLAATLTFPVLAQRARDLTGRPALVNGAASDLSAPMGAPLDDGYNDRPRSNFDQIERTLAGTSARTDVEPSTPAGTVSVEELRHPLSHAGAKLLQQKEAQRYGAAGQHERAIEVLQHGLEDPTAKGYVRSMLGAEYLKTGNMDAAVANLREAVELLPWSAADHSNLGYALCMSGRTEEGEGEIRQAIKLDRNAPQPHFLLGIILLNRATPEAQDQLRLAVNGMSGARLGLAVYHARQGQASEAEQQLEAYLQQVRPADAKRMVKEAQEWLAQTAALKQPATGFGFPLERGSRDDLPNIQTKGR